MMLLSSKIKDVTYSLNTYLLFRCFPYLAYFYYNFFLWYMPVDGLILLGTSLRMLYVAMLQSIHHGHITIFILAENKKIANSLG